MPVTVYASADGARVFQGTRARNEVAYIAEGSEDRGEVYAEVLAELPVVDEGLPLSDIQLFEESGRPGMWRVLAIYALPGDRQPTEVGDSALEFDTGGGTERVKYGINEVSAHTVGATLASTRYAAGLGIVEDGDKVVSVEGRDVVVPEFRFSETHIKSPADVDTDYLKAIADLTGRVNDDVFRGFPAGEVLFLGASGRQPKTPNSNAPWSIRFNFARRPNQEDLSFSVDPVAMSPVVIDGVDKQGWHFLEFHVRSVDQNVVVGGRPPGLYPQIRMIRVVKVYESGDFETLEIGTE